MESLPYGENMKTLIPALLVLISMSPAFAETKVQKLNEYDSSVIYYTLETAGVLVEYADFNSSIQSGPVNCSIATELGQTVIACVVHNLGLYIKPEPSKFIVEVLQRNNVPVTLEDGMIAIPVLDFQCTQTYFLHTAPDCKVLY